jgi:hypothetical protein
MRRLAAVRPTYIIRRTLSDSFLQQGRAAGQANLKPVQSSLSHLVLWLRHLPWEAWTAGGTWFLALATWALTFYTRNLVRRTQEDARAQIETMQRQAKATEEAAKRQMEVTERMANVHIETLREETRVRLMLHYQDSFWSPEMIRYRGKLAYQLRSALESQNATFKEVGERVPLFFEEMGAFLRLGHLDRQTVWTLFGNPAPLYWAALKGFVAEQRAEDPHYWSEFEYLVEDVLYTIEIEATGKTREELEPGKEELVAFLNDEQHSL